MSPHRGHLKIPSWFAAAIVLYAATAGFIAVTVLASYVFPGHACMIGEDVLAHAARLQALTWLTGITAAAAVGSVTAAVLSRVIRR